MAAVVPFQRIPAIKSSNLPGRLPQVTLDENLDCQPIAEACVASLADLQQQHIITDDAFWKDNICMTGSFRTFHTKDTILQAWTELTASRKPSNFKVIPHTAHVFKLGPHPAWINAGFAFEIKSEPACLCSGMLNIVPRSDGSYAIWGMRTILEQLKDGTNPDVPPAVRFKGSAALPDNRATLDCLIVGAGAAGLCLGGRLQSLGLSYLVVDKNVSIGDVWAKRYDSVKLHIGKSFSDMPFERVYQDKPYYLGKDDLAEGQRRFADRWGINVWNSTIVKSARWNAEHKVWAVTLERDGARQDSLRSRHLVMATGGGNDVPHVPVLPDRDTYHGGAYHSSQWQNARPFTGKKGIVIGSANSAFDMIDDMVTANLSSVTMIQRSTTPIVTADYLNPILDHLYNPTADLNLADRIAFGGPYPIGRLMFIAGVSPQIAAAPERYEKLKAAGFRFFEESDVLANVLERFGGHYLDVGQTKLIEDGKVGVVSGDVPVAFTPKGLRLESGRELEADVIVFATGFRGSLRESTAGIVGREITDQLEDFWGVDAEGETRGLAKPIGHPGIWYLGGGTNNARFHSRFLALQIQADVKGMPFEVYDKLRC